MRRARQLQGVAGWLFCLCVTLTVLGPMSFVARWHTGTNTTATGTALDSILCATGIVVGIMLWSRAKHALLAARILLGVLVAVPLISVMHLVETGAAPIAIADQVETGVKCGLWFLYLFLSRRVKNTYGIVA